MHVKGEKIVHVTQMKRGSARHIGEIIIGIGCLLVGVLFVYLFIESLMSPVTAKRPETVVEWIIFIVMYLFLVIFTAGMAVFCFFFGKYQLTIKPKWKFTLFSNEIVAYILDENDERLEETVVPIHKMTRCVIVRREQRQRIHLNKRSFYRYYFFLGAHIYYEEDGVDQIISFEDPNDLEKLDQAVRFLQDERDVPMYFTHVKDDDHKSIDIRELIRMFPPKRFTRPVHLGQLDKPNYNISMFDEMQRMRKAKDEAKLNSMTNNSSHE